MNADDFLVTTIESVPGKRASKVLGLVQGSTIRARWFGADIAAAFRNLAGGEVKAYRSLLVEARDEAVRRMVESAKERGANAVVGMRFATAAIMGGAAEMLAYGTAVVLEDETPGVSTC